MIQIKCKKCGWSLPFSAKTKDSVVDRGSNNVVCPKCGETLIRMGGKVGRWY
ncbi:MAG: hypothetical protein NT038_03005 [Euryarchaeota archaeon]|nr:hypothetical protein [Euryarchaeota archaeon]